MRLIYLFLTMTLLVNIPVFAQDDSCVETRLEGGGYGQVTPGDANNVRDTPASGGELVGQIPGAGVFAVTNADPVCDGSRLWVEVAYADFTGWTVEASGSDYWVNPIEGIVYEDDVVRFVYPEEYLSAIESETLPAQEQMGGLYPVVQEYLLSVDGLDEDINRYFQYMAVMPTDDLTDEAPLAYESLQNLRNLLINQPEIELPIIDIYAPDDPSVTGTSLPHDPLLRGARRMMVSSAHYITAQNASGVAFVTMYSQDILPVYNNGLFYNAILLTDDGEYTVTIRFPVRTDSLRLDDYADFDFPTNWEDQYAGHIINTTNMLDALTPDDWTPSLDMLDAIVASIYVKGDIPEVEAE